MLGKAGVAFALLASARANSLYRRHTRQNQICEPINDVAPALWDKYVPFQSDFNALAERGLNRQCFYPPPTEDFNVDTYLGRWYQVAGNPASFTAACDGCIFAEYSLNANGTVAVTNGCQRDTPAGPVPVRINGTATPAPRAYGNEGVFTVNFPFPTSGADVEGSEGSCPGPNYIVQAFDNYRGWALVQSSNFTTLFVLSREQQRTSMEIDQWLAIAEELGSDISNVVRYNQTGCTAICF
ncbi:hypothetical protein D0868_02192 [Hortaea werneckii]|uniref:Lipocalin/cytosolic fatty-acid binding domain-containing protein n=2 Tax=Hortaea werneckii TaxID=91943 RepID=A0A3M6ZD45_HORWE|nr:hypothetical protein D0868_02192 [Hortaea werneckii]